MTEERAESEPAGSESAESKSVDSEPAESKSVDSEPAGSESAESESAESEPVDLERAGSEPADTSRAEPHSEENRCPECGEMTIPGSDKCQHCGTPLDSGQAISLEMWEWGGMLIAAFGFFLTPVLPGPIALYCAYRVYEYKPSAAKNILIIIVGTVVFWIFLPLVVLPG